MRKTILIITDNLRTQINGVVTTFKNLEIYADRDGYDIVYIDPGQFFHVDAPGYPEVKLSWAWCIGKKIEAVDPDYIHIATEGPVGLAARIWLESKRWRYNTSYHTKFPEFLKKIYGIPKSITYWYVRWFHKNSQVVLTTTNTMVNDLQKHNFKGNIQSWTRGVDRAALAPRKHWHHFHKKPIVLYAGRVSKEKGLDDLCRLQDQYFIEIVGDGPYLAELKVKYPRVKFLGYQQGSDLADSYARADVFCFPSQTDTFGIVIIEAMSVGTPVAAYLVPGPVDIIEQGVTGYMSSDLTVAIRECLKLDRYKIEQKSKKWTWKECWSIFRDNLKPISG